MTGAEYRALCTSGALPQWHEHREFGSARNEGEHHAEGGYEVEPCAPPADVL